MSQGLCAQTDPDAFYPEDGAPATSAKAVCRRCPVQTQCLDYALTHDERHGVWGGTSAAERTRLRDQQALPTRAQRDRANKRDIARRMHAQGRTKSDIARLLRLNGTTLNGYLADQPTTATA
jgi:WhiB family redox-sensing transcriptional regulator